MDIKASCELTPDEVIRAFKAGSKRRLLFMYLALPLVLTVWGFASFLFDDPALGVGLIAGAIAFPLVLRFLVRRNITRQLKHFCLPSTIRVTDDGYEHHTDQYNTTMRWSMFERTITGPEFWLFYVNKQCVAFLPRRAFDATQQAEIDKLLAGYRAAEVV
ncbi:YcxB family protein [Nonomuraea sp. NPDC049784]|uniref:YcxB family protein n=1 Tax=Nonomuraea sp. NPDC049784 TaxID=3154361 RepID=UPI0033EE4852